MTSGILFILFSLIVLMLLALIASLLLNDAGYVLVIWNGWQAQSSVGFLLLTTLVCAIGFILLFFISRAILYSSSAYREKRKIKSQVKTLISLDDAIRNRLVENFTQAFAVMEKALTRYSLNQHPLNKKKGSALHLLQADAAKRAKRYPDALAHLTEIDSDDHELASLIRAQIYLETGDLVHAQSTLELLLAYPEQGYKEPVREALQPKFDEQVGILWSRLAALQPWDMLTRTRQPLPSLIDWSLWLQALNQAVAPAEVTLLISRLLEQMPIAVQDQHASLLFALLARYGTDQQIQTLIQRIFGERLDPDLLNSWTTYTLLQTTKSPVTAPHDSAATVNTAPATDTITTEPDPVVSSDGGVSTTATQMPQQKLSQPNQTASQIPDHVDSILSQLEQRYPAQPDIALARTRWQAQIAVFAEPASVLHALAETYPQHSLIQHYLQLAEITRLPLSAEMQQSLLTRLVAAPLPLIPPREPIAPVAEADTPVDVEPPAAGSDQTL